MNPDKENNLYINFKHYIEKYGPLPVDQFMKMALTANKFSYYQSISDIGIKGDFVTSPEISQMFGEIIALWVIEKYLTLNNAQNFTLLELGPGSGTLQRDMLKVLKLNPELFSNLKILLFETNPQFIKNQKKLLNPYKHKITWIENLEKLPKNPLIVVTNEFFDALPIKQYIKKTQYWHEVTLVLDPVTQAVEYDTANIKETLQSQFKKEHINATNGSILEESTESIEVMNKISAHIKKYKGAALIIDYGYYIKPNNRTRSQYNSTLQAIRAHKFVDVFSDLGKTDISAHVNFYDLENSALSHGIQNTYLYSQGDFLIKYGILIRLKTLIQKQSINETKLNRALTYQVDWLINTQKMGNLFKILEIINC